MGARGPTRKPTSIRGVKASREYRVPAPGVAPAMPAWLPKEARAVWRGVVPRLLAAGVPLAHADAEMLAAYCFATWQSTSLAQEAMQESTLTNRARLLRLSQKMAKDAAQFGDKLGTTPISRARLNIKPQTVAPDDEWAQFD